MAKERKKQGESGKPRSRRRAAGRSGGLPKTTKNDVPDSQTPPRAAQDEVAVLRENLAVTEQLSAKLAEDRDRYRDQLASLLTLRVDDPAAEKSPTFLLRLPADLRTQLEELKEESKARSLQALILQLIAEGIAKKSGFEVAELFAKDLHVKTLNAAVGGSAVADLNVDGYSFKLKRVGEWSTGDETASLLAIHERVVQELEAQKLTGFATLMDPALMSYRLLLQVAAQQRVPGQISGETLVRDFSNGLKSSAEHAIRLGRWGLAETLLLQACQVDLFNEELACETGIYLLRRLVRRWRRPSDRISTGVTNGTLVWGDYKLQSAAKGAPEDESHSTHFHVADRAFELLQVVAQDTTDKEAETAKRGVPVSGRNSTRFRGTSPKLACWYHYSVVIRMLISPSDDGLEFYQASEQRLVNSIVSALTEWQQSFRMTRDLNMLQQEWRDWFEALEILWWLGYRKEAFSIAHGARGFVSDKTTTYRFILIHSWNPDSERTEMIHENDPYGLTVIDRLEETSDGEFNVVGYLEQPDALYNRPDGA